LTESVESSTTKDTCYSRINWINHMDLVPKQ